MTQQREKRQQLFNYMSENHGVTLMETDMIEIERMLTPDEQLTIKTSDMPGDIQKIVDDNFSDLIDPERKEQ